MNETSVKWKGASDYVVTPLSRKKGIKPWVGETLEGPCVKKKNKIMTMKMTCGEGKGKSLGKIENPCAWNRAKQVL